MDRFGQMLIGWWLMGCSLLGVAQDPHFITLDRTSGLPNNNVYDIFQDSKGYIWIATNDGICRYDGAAFKSYKSSSQSSLGGSTIAEDSQKRIWYQNFDGQLFYVKNDSLHAFVYDNSMGYSPQVFSSKHLFIPTYKGLEVYDVKTLKQVQIFPFDLPISITPVCIDDNIVFVHQGYFYSIDRNLTITSKKFTYLHSQQSYLSEVLQKNLILIPKNAVTSEMVYTDPTGQLIKKTSLPNDINAQNISLLENEIWINTSSGTLRMNADYSFSTFFKNQNINCLLKDREGNIWVGTGGSGIQLITNFQNRSILQDEKSIVRLKIANGLLYAGSTDNDLFEVDLVKNQITQRNKLGDSREIAMIFVDPKTKVKYVSSDYLYTINSEQNIPVKKDRLAVKSMCIVDEKYLGFSATGISGLIVRQGAERLESPWDQWGRHHQMNTSLNIMPIEQETRGKDVEYVDAKKTLYMLTNNGLLAFTTSTKKEILDDNKPVYGRQLHQYNGNLIILKTDGTLHLMDAAEKISEIHLDKDYRILQCNVFKDYIFVATQKNILCYNFLTKQSHILPIDISSLEVLDFVVIENNIYIGHSKGLLLCDWKQKMQEAKEIHFEIQAFNVNGKKLDPFVFHELENFQNNFKIEFALLHYNIASFNNEYYRINNGEWKRIDSKQRLIEATDLAPGDYLIEFKISNQIQPKKIQFKILQPIYLRPWFIAFCVMLAVASVFLIDQWKISRLVKKNNLLQEKNELLESNILLEQSLSKSMLTSIRAQMNPHFFYNALNTIHAYIFNNDKQKAGSYLVKFSKLTRMILEMSEREYVSLSEEIKSLQLYLDLEKMRFVSDFEFIIKEENLGNADILEIPSMIVQPFVENAIKHGLHHKKEDRKLMLEFELKGDLLCITIDDNGVGRVRSRQLNEKRKDHKSFSISAIDKRIELINHRRPNSIKVETLDKYNTSGIALGTKVTITIQTKFHR